MTGSVRKAAARPAQVAPRRPDPALPDADWADAFEVETSQLFPDMRTLAQQTVGSMPPWSRALLRLRNALVGPFGLKSDGSGDASASTGMVGIFPILKEFRDRIVLGLDDRHLDFRIVLERSGGDRGDRVRLTTLVRWHGLAGRLYIAAVTPFHRAIVAAVLRQVR